MMVCMTAAIFAGNVVPVSEAQLVAKNFIQANFPTQSHPLSEFTLIHTEMDDANEPVYYVFSIGDKRIGSFRNQWRRQSELWVRLPIPSAHHSHRLSGR